MPLLMNLADSRLRDPQTGRSVVVPGLQGGATFHCVWSIDAKSKRLLICDSAPYYVLDYPSLKLSERKPALLAFWKNGKVATVSQSGGSYFLIEDRGRMLLIRGARPVSVTDDGKHILYIDRDDRAVVVNEEGFREVFSFRSDSADATIGVISQLADNCFLINAANSPVNQWLSVKSRAGNRVQSSDLNICVPFDVVGPISFKGSVLVFLFLL